MSTGNWRDDEIRELLAARAGIAWQITGTARDSVVYDQLTKRLQERGLRRGKAQVITKLKSLKKTYHRFVQYNSCEGNKPRWWTYFQMCDDIWGADPQIKQVVVGGGIKDSPPTSPGTETPLTRAGTQINGTETQLNGTETPVTSPETLANTLGRPVHAIPEKPERAACSWSGAEQSDSGEQWVSSHKRPASDTFGKFSSTIPCCSFVSQLICPAAEMCWFGFSRPIVPDSEAKETEAPVPVSAREEGKRDAGAVCGHDPGV